MRQTSDLGSWYRIRQDVRHSIRAGSRFTDAYYRYWDNSYNDFNYSYVNVATDKYKYSTFAYDRLGIGNSSHGEPLNEIQSFLEVAALAELTMKLRNGTVEGISQKFDKIIHVGYEIPFKFFNKSSKNGWQRNMQKLISAQALFWFCANIRTRQHVS